MRVCQCVMCVCMDGVLCVWVCGCTRVRKLSSVAVCCVKVCKENCGVLPVRVCAGVICVARGVCVCVCVCVHFRS